MDLRDLAVWFGRGVGSGRTTALRPGRCALPEVESVERRVSLSSGVVISSVEVCGFNPQPDPPSRAAIIAIMSRPTT